MNVNIVNINKFCIKNVNILINTVCIYNKSLFYIQLKLGIEKLSEMVKKNLISIFFKFIERKIMYKNVLII